MVKDHRWKVGIFLGISLIGLTASFLTLPALMDEGTSKNAYTETLEKLQTSENKMLDFIANERKELSSRINGLSFP